MKEPADADRRYIAANPYRWPWNGDLRPDNTALVVIDMQTDFCGKGGYIDGLGYDISATRAPIEPIRRVLARARALGYRVIHTREGHRPDLSAITHGLFTVVVAAQLMLGLTTLRALRLPSASRLKTRMSSPISL